MEPSWVEALDVDDSDLQPLTVLRPCKQQRRCDQTNPSYLSQSQTLDSSQSSQTVNSLPRNLTSANQDEAPPPSRTIPGPAGIVQAAKLRKTRDNVNCLGQEEHPMATQEYIRKAVEDPEEDDDFKCSPWISALEFVYAEGTFNSPPNAPLGEINKYQKNGKLDQVVAVIKSCTPNELGDMTVALKDPTGTVSGTIHHKVLTEGEFGKGICVGSVLILHKVSVFSPSRSAHYLNITKRNLVKVFYKDGGSSQKQTIRGTRDAAPHSDSGRGGSALSLEREAEQIVNGMKRSKQSLHIISEQENINPIVSIGHQYSNTSNNATNQMIATSDKEIIKEANVIENAENEHGQLIEGNTNGLEGKEQARVIASLTNWTNEQVEQLNELLAGDFEDNI